MDCLQIAAKIQQRNPRQAPRDIARRCLMFLNAIDDPQLLANRDIFEEIWKDVELKYHAATDQHAAMTCELEELASSDPRRFSPDQIWTLVRAIKVQSQVLRLFTGDAPEE